MGGVQHQQHTHRWRGLQPCEAPAALAPAQIPNTYTHAAAPHLSTHTIQYTHHILPTKPCWHMRGIKAIRRPFFRRYTPAAGSVPKQEPSP